MKNNYLTSFKMLVMLVACMVTGVFAAPYEIKVEQIYCNVGSDTATMKVLMKNEKPVYKMKVNLSFPDELATFITSGTGSYSETIQKQKQNGCTQTFLYSTKTKLAVLNLSQNEAGGPVAAANGFVEIASMEFTLNSAAVTTVEDYTITVAPQMLNGANWEVYDETAPANKGSVNPTDESVVLGVNGIFSVVQYFNVAIAAKEVDFDKQTSVASAAAAFTNETGAAYPAGGTLDSALEVALADGEYDAAKHGSFSVSGNTIVWDSSTYDRAVVGHNSLTFNVSYTAQSSDDNKYNASGVYKLVVNPVNQAPVVSDLTVIAATEGAPFSFSVTVVDPEGDNIAFSSNSIDLTTGDGTKYNLKGNWSRNDNLSTFTTTANIPFEVVTHTESESNVLATVDGEKCFYTSWSAFLMVRDAMETYAPTFEAGSTAGDYKTWIKDADQKQTNPAINAFSPETPTTSNDITLTIDSGTDADVDDEIVTHVSWSNGTTTVPEATLESTNTKKGETWTPTVYTTTKPYGTDVKSDEIVGEGVMIQNTTPTLAGDKTNMVVVRPTEATETKPSKSLTFTITDPDADVETFALVEKTAPAKGTIKAEFNDTTMTLTYTVNNPDAEESDNFDTFTFAVKDSDDAESNPLEVTVQYLEHQLPEITITGPADALDEVVTDDADAAKKGEAPATSFTIEVTAVDKNEEGETGITAIELTVPEGWSYETVETTRDGNKTTLTASFVVTTAGYDTIAGADRAASGDFELTVKATDVTGIDSEEKFMVTINDFDRVATAPTALGLSGDALHTGDIVSATPSGAEDADGDAISYKMTLSVGGAALESDIVVAEGEQYDSIATVKKGQVPNVKAVAISKAPYAGDAVDGGELADDLDAVANTAPVAFAKATITWEGAVDGYNEEPLVFAIENAQYENQEAFDAANEQVRYEAADETIAAYYDIDEAAGADTVTITVDASGIADYATVEYADGQLTITRIVNKCTLGLETLPSFKIIATDESGESAEVEIPVEITPVNTKPVVEKADIYVLPSDIDGKEKSVTFQMASMGACDYEDNTQKILAVKLVSCEWAGVLTAEPTFVIAEDGKSFDVKFTMDMNAEAGTELPMVITVQDDGDTPFEDTSDEVTIKFVIGSTPWYPILDTECEAGHDAHQLVITPVGGGAATTLIVEGGELRPADYYEQGCKGLASGDYTVAAYAWTVADGAAADACYNGEFTVPEYDVPGEASVEYANGSITVNAPLASSYVLTIYKDGAVVKTITKDFVPNEDGLIVPNEEFDYTFSEAGTYTATIHGHNPKGDGIESAETELIVIAEEEDVELAWPEDGVFTPQGVIYLNEGATSINVSFSWPVVNAAVKYTLVILNGATNLNFEVDVTANTYEKNLSLTESKGKANFNWYVIAIGADGNELSSDAMDFSLVQKTSKAVIDGIYVENDGDDTVIIDAIGIDNVSKVDIQIAHIEGKQVDWFVKIKSQNGAADLVANEDGSFSVTIPQDSTNKKKPTINKGDIAVIRFYYTDGSVDKYTTYTVKKTPQQ